MLAVLFFYIGAPLLGMLFVPGIIIFATAPTYKIETTIDKTKCTVTHKTTLLSVRIRKQVSLSEVSMLAKITGYEYGKYSKVYLIANNLKMKICEFTDPDIDAVNSPVLDRFVSTVQNFCELRYEKSF